VKGSALIHQDAAQQFLSFFFIEISLCVANILVRPARVDCKSVCALGLQRAFGSLPRDIGYYYPPHSAVASDTCYEYILPYLELDIA